MRLSPRQPQHLTLHLFKAEALGRFCKARPVHELDEPLMTPPLPYQSL